MEIIDIANVKEWKDRRKFYITGTKLKKIIGKDARQKMIAHMIAEEFGHEENGYESEDMQRGKLLEPWALDDYEKNIEKDLKIIRNVFVIKDDLTALSPDGLIMIDGIIKRGLEIKSLALPNHLYTVITDKYPAEYKWQLVHYFVTIDTLEELDFISYNINCKKRMILLRFYRQDFEKEITTAKNALEKFRQEYNQALLKVL